MDHFAATKQALDTEILKELKSISEDPVTTATAGLRTRLGLWGFGLMNRLRKSQIGFFQPPKSNFKTDPDLSKLPNALQQLFNQFEIRRQKFRSLNYHYTDQYSGGYKLNYRLAYLAVTLAVLSLFFLYLRATFDDEAIDHIVHWSVIIMGVSKLLILILIVINTLQANGRDFNRRAVSVRYVMEKLRCMAFLSLVNLKEFPGTIESKRVTTRSPMKFLDTFIDATVLEIFDAQANAVSANDENKVIDEEAALASLLQAQTTLISFLRQEWVLKQAGYHQAKAEAQRKLDERLEKRIKSLNNLVLLLVSIDVAAGATEIFHWLPEIAEHVIMNYMTPLIFVSAAIIPAMVASFNGLRSQADARKMADRAESMETSLLDAAADFNDLANNHKLSVNERGDLLDQLCLQTAHLMLSEVTEWTLIFTRDIAEP